MPKRRNPAGRIAPRGKDIRPVPEKELLVTLEADESKIDGEPGYRSALA